jgi:hypothetical protein
MWIKPIAVSIKPGFLDFHSPNLQVWDYWNLQSNDGRAFTPLLPIKRSLSVEGRKRPHRKKLLVSFCPGLKPWAMDSFPNQTLLSFLNQQFLERTQLLNPKIN